MMIEKHEGLLYHKLVQKLNQEYGLPPSTVRWNMNKLRSAKLILAGDQKTKGIPVRLTEEAKLIISAQKQYGKSPINVS